MYEKKINRKFRPGYLKQTKIHSNTLFYFRVIDLPKMTGTLVFWIFLSVTPLFVFNSLRIKGAIINLDLWGYQALAFALFLFFSYKFFSLLTKKVTLRITPKMLVVSEKKTLFSKDKERIKVRNRELIDFYLDVRQMNISTQHILSVLTSDGRMRSVVVGTSPNLVAYLKQTIKKHSFSSRSTKRRYD